MPALGTGDAADATPGRMASQTGVGQVFHPASLDCDLTCPSPATHYEVNPAPPATTPKMYIYVCIIRKKYFSWAREVEVVANSAATIDYGTPSTSLVIRIADKNIRRKTVEFFASASPTGPCAGMSIIHFARAIMHQSALLHSVRLPEEMFPGTARGPLNSFKMIWNRRA